MISLEEYLADPCGTLSIPYWKNKNISIPPNMLILHQKDYATCDGEGYADEQYFRLYHSLKNIKETKLDGFDIKTAAKEDIPTFMTVINRSYTDLSVTYKQLVGYTETKVYTPDLWVLVVDRGTSEVVGCGIAELDKELREGVIEWVQVLPEYRGRKIGQLIVNALLKRLSQMADFATVSGKIGNPTNPEMLYRKCGFTGTDVWHILRK